jgi:hypothetical protein
MYWTITTLQSAWNYLSNEWLFIPIGLRTRELRPFYFVGASCPGRYDGWILEFNLQGSPSTKEFYPEPHHLSISLMDV